MSEQNFDMYSASIEGALVLFLMPWFSFIPILGLCPCFATGVEKFSKQLIFQVTLNRTTWKLYVVINIFYNF